MDTKNPTRREFLRLAALTSVGLVVACTGSPQPATPPVQPPTAAAQPTVVPATAAPKIETVKIRGATNLDPASVSWAPYFSIGAYLGWLKDESVDVQIDTIETATALTLVTKGDLEFLIGAPETLLGVEGKGTKTGVKFAYSYYTKPWYLLAVNPDSPIKTIAELKGKTIGLSSLGPPQIPAVEIYLRSAGLKAEDVKMVAVSNKVSAAQMLKDGQVDAMMQTANNMTVFENAGFTFRFFPKPAELDNLFGAGYYVHERSISNPTIKDALGRYFRVVAKSVLFMKTNPEAAVRIHWKVKPDSKPTGQSEEKALANAMRDLATTAEYAGKPSSGKWGEYNSDKMRAYIAFAGVSDTLKDPGYLYTTAFVQAANAFKDDDVVAFAKNYVFK